MKAEIIEFCGKNFAGFSKPRSVDFWKEPPKRPRERYLEDPQALHAMIVMIRRCL